MKPNIFEIGTKELNQDVFITWLLRYADDEGAESFTEDDRRIHLCAKEFVKALLSNAGIQTDFSINSVKADRQWDGIDVWALINDKYAIIIEDKTNTGQHSNQLSRYKAIAEEWCENEGYILNCIYLKTGNEAQLSLRRVEQEGFSIFNRRLFLNLLNNHQDIANQIFIDFRERLLRLEAVNNAYVSKKIGDWKADDWIGFYQYLETRIDNMPAWGYVSNPLGGFWCAVIDWPIWNGFPVYFQLQENDGVIRFKICFEEGEIDHEPRTFDAYTEQDNWHKIVLDNARIHFPVITRPQKYVHRGNARTVAIIKKESWLGGDDEFLDKEAVVQRLLSYRAFVRDIINQGL